MQCDRCGAEQFTTAGRDRHGRHLHRCTACGRGSTTRSGSAFSGYRFPDAIIARAVRCSLRYRLRYAAVVAWLAERGITVDPRSVYDWVRALAQWAPPRFIDAARAYRSPVGQRWRVDEMSITIGKRWLYRFRAIGEQGQILDVYLSARRHRAAAQAFVAAAIATSTVPPTRVTSDQATCYPPALRTVLLDVEHRTSKDVNNGLERDHQQGCPLGQGRLRLMRSFTRMLGAGTFCHGERLIRNRRGGFSTQTPSVSIYLRLATAWAILAANV